MRLERLITQLGERSDYDAVSQCTRCGYCSQACPTHAATGREAFSGRGRNQIVRMLIEGKFADPSAAEEALSTCLLCGACTTACPGHVPTADLVLEGRRMLRGERLHYFPRLLTWLISEKRGLFHSLLRWGYRFKRWGLAGLAVRTGVLRLIGLRGLEEAAGHVDELPEKFLFELFEDDRRLIRESRPKWLYFAPCGVNYLYPQVGLATVRVLRRMLGPGRWIEHGCCGLIAYNYGELSRARELARRLIALYEAAEVPADIPIVGDCSSCVAFMKSYPQLFMDDPEWKSRAERFSGRVRDFLEAVPAQPAKRAFREKTTYHESCRARSGQGIVEEPRRLMRDHCPSCEPLPESDMCCGGAGAFAFMHPELSDDLLKRKISNIASTQARVVAASSTSCLIQLARGLKKYYPECRVVHVSELLSQTTDG